MQPSRHLSYVGDWVVVTVLGDVDLSSAPALRHDVIALLSEGHRKIALDLGPTDFVDSVGLGIIVAIWKRVRVQGGTFAVVCPEPRLKRVFQVVDLDKVLPLHDTVAAVTSLEGPPAGSVDSRE